MQQMPVVGRIRSLRQRSSRRAQLFSDIAKLMRLGQYWLLFCAFIMLFFMLYSSNTMLSVVKGGEPVFLLFFFGYVISFYFWP